MTFHVYENHLTRRVTIHRSERRHVRPNRSTADRGWGAPFETHEEAATYAETTTTGKTKGAVSESTAAVIERTPQ